MFNYLLVAIAVLNEPLRLSHDRSVTLQILKQFKICRNLSKFIQIQESRQEGGVGGVGERWGKESDPVVCI